MLCLSQFNAIFALYTKETMELRQGTLLKCGEYRIAKVIGQGGFGITYLADKLNIGRQVAIKEFFMKEHCNREQNSSLVTIGSLGSRNIVERFRHKFLKEARTLASFNNEHIIKIYDVFEENGTAYYVMEYIEGDNLASLVSKQGALCEASATRYIYQVCKALIEVHSRNLLHLDIKPANIMLNSNDNAVLIDFGISKHYDNIGMQTSSAAVGVSEGYAPLEQYESGALESFTPATDIYAVGATLFFLLTGTRPPKAGDVMNDGLPILPEVISFPVRHAIESAMHPRRKERPQSIGDFLEQFQMPATKEMYKKEPPQNIRKYKVEKETSEDRKNTPRQNRKGKIWIPLLVLAVLIGCGIFLLGNNDNKNTGEKIPEEDKGNNATGENKTDDNLLIPLLDNNTGKWGFADKEGNEILPCKYDDIEPYDNGLAAVETDGKWGFIDKKGTEITPFKYDYVGNFSEGMAAICEGKYPNDKWGFVDNTGKEVVPCKYDYAYPFSEGMAVVREGDWENGKWGFIDKTGEKVISCKYDYVNNFSEGMAAVGIGADWENGKWGFIDKTGKEVTPLQYCVPENALEGPEPPAFSEGMVAVRDAETNKMGFVDKTGKEVVPCIYDDAYPFSEGMAAVCEGDWGTGKWGFIDKVGEKVISCKYDYVNNFSEGMAAVREDKYPNDKWGFVDKTGKEVVPCQYELAADYIEGMAPVMTGYDEGGYAEWGYDNWKFIDKNGKDLSPCKYALLVDGYYIHYASQDRLFAVRDAETGKWGFVNNTGKEVIPCKYDDMNEFSNGIAKATLDGREFYIDKTGKEYIKY